MGDRGEGWGPLLAETKFANEVFLPLRATGRIKYTSFDVSKRYLVFGASSGGIYLFHRETLKFLQVLANKDGAITQISLASDDNVIGYATAKGLVVVLEHNVERRGSHHTPRRLHVSYEHKGATVTSVRWNSASSRFFVGDDRGRVSVVNVLSSKAKILFQVPTVVIMRLDSRVIQLDFAHDKLVASTLSRCYLCDTVEEQYTQIGKKTRDGEFGACFFTGTRVQTPSIYATRPGSRMWEVDFHGTVLNTHQFKEALALPPQPITTVGREFKVPTSGNYRPQNINFGRILPLSDKYLITWAESGMYIFDPVNATVVLWSNDVIGIRDLKCYKSDFFVWLLDGTFRTLSLLSPEKFVYFLYSVGEWLLCSQIALHYEAAILNGSARRYVSSNMLHNLATRLCEEWASDAAEEEVASIRRILASRVDSLATKVEEADCASMSSSHSGRSSSTDSYSIHHDGYSMRQSDSEDDRPNHRVRYLGASPRRPRSATSRGIGGSNIAAFRPISPSSSKLRPKSASPTVLTTRVPNGVSSGTTLRNRLTIPRLMSTSTVVEDEPARFNDSRMTQSMTVLERRRAHRFEDPSSGSPSSLKSCVKGRKISLPTQKSVPTSSRGCGATASTNVQTNVLVTVSSAESNSSDTKTGASSAFKKMQIDRSVKPVRLKSPISMPGTSASHRKYSRSDSDSTDDVFVAARVPPVGRRVRYAGRRESPSDCDRTDVQEDEVVPAKPAKLGVSFLLAKHHSCSDDDNDNREQQTEKWVKESSYEHTPNLKPVLTVTASVGSVQPTLVVKPSLVCNATGGDDDVDITDITDITDMTDITPNNDSQSILSDLQLPISPLLRKSHSTEEITDVGATHTPTSNAMSPIRHTQSMDFNIEDKNTEQRKRPREITLSFPLTPYSAYGFSDFAYSDSAMMSEYTTVTIPAPAAILDLKDSLTSTLQSNKERLKQTIVEIEERLKQMGSPEDPPELLDVRRPGQEDRRGATNLLEQLQDQERQLEPIATSVGTTRKARSSSKARSPPSSKDVLQMTSYRTGAGFTPLPMAEVTSRLVEESRVVFKKLTELGADDDDAGTVESARTCLLQTWLVVLEEAHAEFLAKLKENVTLTSAAGDRLEEEQSESATPKDGTSGKSVDSLLSFLEERLASIIFVDDPFELKEEDLEVVSSLAKTCFKAKIFKPTLLSNGSQPSHNEQEHTTSDEGCRPDNGEVCVGGDVMTESIMTRNIGKLDDDFETWLESVQNLSCIRFPPDAQVAGSNGCEFVRRFFYLLDADEALADTMSWSDHPRFAMWSKIIDGVQETLAESDAYHNLLKCATIDPSVVLKWPTRHLLALLKRLMSTNPSIAVDLCVRCRSAVSSLETLYLCRHSDSPAHWFELYISRTMATSTAAAAGAWSTFHTPIVIGQLSDVCRDELSAVWAAMLLAKGAAFREMLKCYCGFPRPWAHQAPWPHSAVLWQLLKKEGRWTDVLATWCYICGYWPGYLLHCCLNQKCQIQMELIVQLGDIKLIDLDSECGFFPDSHDQWRQLLSLIAKQQRSAGILQCIRCDALLWKATPGPSPTSDGSKTPYLATTPNTPKTAADVSSPNVRPPTLTWSNVCQVLVQKEGVAQAVSLLQAVEDGLPAGSLTPECLRTLVLTAVAKNLPRSASQQKLSAKDNFSWYQSPKVLGPELYHLYKAEKLQHASSDNVASCSGGASVLRLPLPTTTTSQPGYGKVREAAAHTHWGSTLKLRDDCANCCLPLTLGTSALVQGVTIFDCGHRFHASCVEKGHCLLCHSD